MECDANIDKPLIKPIVEALLRDGFTVFVDRPQDEGLGFSADEIAYWRDNRNRLSHLRPAEVRDYDNALRNQVKKGALAVAWPPLHTTEGGPGPFR
jgi:hypothetical protein